MKTFLSRFLMLAVIATCLVARPLPVDAHDGLVDPDLVQKLLPAVVNIFVRKPPELATTSASAGDRSDTADSGPWKRYFGSGFVIDPSGIIVTNRHVVDDARDIIVGFMDGRRAMAKLIAAGGEVDLALIKISSDTPLPVLRFGDSDKVRIGDPVLAIGNPLGIGMSVSSGIVSALNRDIKDGPYDDFIQTDAAINHGNSGGPLVNAAGEVIGVNTALYSDISNGGSIGLGFAITSKDTQFIVDRLMRYGRVRAGWLGASLQDVTQVIAEAMSLPSADGSIVDGIDPGTPAATIGLREGDILLKINDEAPGDARAFMRAIARRQVGSTVQLTIWREGGQQVLPVTLAEWPGDMQNLPKPVMTEEVDRGLQLSDVTEPLERKYDIASGQTGVVVTGVAPEIVTGERALVPGDVILRVQGVAARSPAQVWSTLAEARKENRRLVVMLVKGREGQTWLPLLLSSMR